MYHNQPANEDKKKSRWKKWGKVALGVGAAAGLGALAYTNRHHIHASIRANKVSNSRNPLAAAAFHGIDHLGQYGLRKTVDSAILGGRSYGRGHPLSVAAQDTLHSAHKGLKQLPGDIASIAGTVKHEARKAIKKPSKAKHERYLQAKHNNKEAVKAHKASKKKKSWF